MSMDFLQPEPGSLLSFHEISNFSSIFFYFQFFSPTFPSFVCIFFWKKISFCLIQSILIRFHAESLIKTKYLGWWLIRWKTWVSVWMIPNFRELHKEQSKVRWLTGGWALGWCSPLNWLVILHQNNCPTLELLFLIVRLKGNLTISARWFMPLNLELSLSTLPFRKGNFIFKKIIEQRCVMLFFIFFPREFRKHWGLIVSASSTLHNHRTWWA